MTIEEFRQRWRGEWLHLGMDTFRIFLAEAPATTLQEARDGIVRRDDRKMEALLELTSNIDKLIDRMWKDIPVQLPILNGALAKPPHLAPRSEGSVPIIQAVNPTEPLPLYPSVKPTANGQAKVTPPGPAQSALGRKP